MVVTEKLFCSEVPIPDLGEGIEHLIPNCDPTLNECHAEEGVSPTKHLCICPGEELNLELALAPGLTLASAVKCIDASLRSA